MDSYNLKKIKEIHQNAGDPVFRMAISHLFDVGVRNLTEKSINEAKKEIRETTKSNSFMTADFQCSLLDIALELSIFSIWDVLLYVKLYVGMDGDDTANKEEAQDAIRMWAREKTEWQEAIQDLETLDEIIYALLQQRLQGGYTREEIEDAFNYVLEVEDNG